MAVFIRPEGQTNGIKTTHLVEFKTCRTKEHARALPQNKTVGQRTHRITFAREELPLTVREAAVYLGVSVQTVYLWVERKQIPHLRVMGRNIRFLKSDLEPFRAAFKQEVGNGKT